MSNWSIGLTESPGRRSVISDVLTAQAAWKLLSPSAKDAVIDAYPDRDVRAHPLTMNALERHGFIDGLPGFGYNLTPAAREVYRWVSKP